MNVALLIILAVLALTVYLGIRARRGRDMDLEQWSVGGRGFGTVFVFVLLAGEKFTTFTFLGASGFAYGQGGPAFFILFAGPLIHVISYWLLPPVWRYAKENRLHSQADFFASKYRSTGLGVLVSLMAVVAMVPYLAVMFREINAERPGFLSLPSEGLSVPWFVSTVLMSAAGFYMYPHVFGSAFSARNPRTFRRNAVFMPLYELIMLFAFFVGFAAIL